MNIVLFITGIILLALAIVDVIRTTLTAKGWGPLTGLFYEYIWKPHLGRGRQFLSSWLLTSLGPLSVVVTIAIWIVTIWVSLVLIFQLNEGAVLHSNSGVPADIYGVMYFVGYTLSTLGVGDYVPEHGRWQIITIIISTGGFLMLTVIVTYLVPILTEVVDSWRVSHYIFSLGEKPEDKLVLGWNGSDFSKLENHLINITPLIFLLSQRYLAYPTLFYYYSNNKDASISWNIALLDESVTLMEYGLRSDVRPHLSTLKPMRQALDLYIRVFKTYYKVESQSLPPFPDLNILRNAGIPTVDDNTFRAALEDVKERRLLLNALVSSDGWKWD